MVQNQKETPSSKWWDKWHKSRFSDPLHPNAFTFFPGLEMLASKLGINSYKGFGILVFILVLVGFGLSLFKDAYYPENYQSNTKVVTEGYKNFPELRIAIILIVVSIVSIVLIAWWLRHRDDGGIWKPKS